MGDLSTHFSRREFMCKCGCGFATVDSELLTVLEALRAHFDSTVRINSGCRCPSHNRAIGGSTDSEHTRGTAADIVVDGFPASTVYDWLIRSFPGRYGIGLYPGWTHIDVRLRPARWMK